MAHMIGFAHFLSFNPPHNPVEGNTTPILDEAKKSPKVLQIVEPVSKRRWSCSRYRIPVLPTPSAPYRLGQISDNTGHLLIFFFFF